MEDEMVAWHHQLNGYGFGWFLGAGDGQGGLACCSSWGRKELDLTMTEQQQKSHRLMRGRSFLAISGKGWGFLGIVVLPTF